MPDIRLLRPRGDRLWLWVGLFALLGLLAWASAFVVGDATEEKREVGANLGFGEVRAPVIPAQPTPFRAISSLQARDLGRLVRVEGVVQSRVAANAAWVRTEGGRRILVRFEPAPPPEDLQQVVRSGGTVELDGYLSKISRAEFEVWMDTLGVNVPRPPPGRKFGDLPDPNFARVDSLFVKNFYISVRPEALRDDAEPADSAAAAS